MTLSRTICLGFMAVIAFGAMLLVLPFASGTGGWGDPIAALFMSTSAVCVTGLSVIPDLGNDYSGFGQLVLLMLAQVGGLGYMTATTFLLLLLGKKFKLKEKVAIQQSLDARGMAGMRQVIISIIAVTLLFELTGAFLLMLTFVPQMGWPKGIWYGIFHSVSAFNNAGFGLLPDNLMQYVHSPIVNFTIAGLIIGGGIGYQVIMEAFLETRDRLQAVPGRLSMSLHFKVVTTTTAILLVGGLLLFLSTEFHNAKTLGALNLPSKLMAAWFQSVTPRTAGFNTISIGDMTTAGLFITIALMFMGASPGGTGGGVKTTTMRVLFDCTRAALQGHDEVICYQRRLPTSLIFKAVGVVFGSLMTVIVATILLALADRDLEFLPLFFEVVSAFGTVGLSMGAVGTTASLSIKLTVWGKLIIIGTMYIGRVGILLLMSALLGDADPPGIRYPEDDLLVG
jgi:trk system potassium uptake protein